MKTGSQLGYYWAVVIPTIQEFGYTKAQAHVAAKASYFNMNPDDPNLPSMTKMSAKEMADFLDYAIQTCAELGKCVKEPRL